MHKDRPRMAAELSQALTQVRTGAPETMKAFSAPARAALEPKALDGKTKELLALGIAVSAFGEPFLHALLRHSMAR